MSYVNNKFQGINNSAIKTKRLTIYHLTPMQSAGALADEEFCSCPEYFIIVLQRARGCSVIKKCQGGYTVAPGSREQIAKPGPRPQRALISEARLWFV